MTRRFLYCMGCCALVLSATVGFPAQTPASPPGAGPGARLSRGAVHCLPMWGVWTVSPNGDCVALVATREDSVDIEVYSLRTSHSIARRVLSSDAGYTPGTVAWSPSGRLLAVCDTKTLTVLEYKPGQRSLPTRKRVAAPWQKVVFARDNTTLFGFAQNGSGESTVSTLSLTAPDARPVIIKTDSLTMLNTNTPFLPLDNKRVLLVGVGHVVDASGNRTPGALIGGSGMYDLVMTLQNRNGKRLALCASQPVTPKGKYSIMLVDQTHLYATDLDGKRKTPVPWPARDRIEELQVVAGRRLFARLYRDNGEGGLVLREYTLSLGDL